MDVIAALLDLVYPPLCALCGATTPTAFCSGCEKRLEWVEGKTCGKCGAGASRGPCQECKGRTYPFERTVAVGRYVGNLRDLLLQFKLGGQIYLARDLGRRLAQRVLDAGFPVDAVVPVPMRRRGLVSRGYNPAAELAAQIGKSLQRPFVPALRKVRATKPQARLPRKEREVNLDGAFRVYRPRGVQGKSVLLVDDVLTTGATASECTRALLASGAREVNLAVVGR